MCVSIVAKKKKRKKRTYDPSKEYEANKSMHMNYAKKTRQPNNVISIRSRFAKKKPCLLDKENISLFNNHNAVNLSLQAYNSMSY